MVVVHDSDHMLLVELGEGGHAPTADAPHLDPLSVCQSMIRDGQHRRVAKIGTFRHRLSAGDRGGRCDGAIWVRYDESAGSSLEGSRSAQPTNDVPRLCSSGVIRLEDTESEFPVGDSLRLILRIISLSWHQAGSSSREKDRSARGQSCPNICDDDSPSFDAGNSSHNSLCPINYDGVTIGYNQILCSKDHHPIGTCCDAGQGKWRPHHGHRHLKLCSGADEARRHQIKGTVSRSAQIVRSGAYRLDGHLRTVPSRIQIRPGDLDHARATTLGLPGSLYPPCRRHRGTRNRELRSPIHSAEDWSKATSGTGGRVSPTVVVRASGTSVGWRCVVLDDWWNGDRNHSRSDRTGCSGSCCYADAARPHKAPRPRCSSGRLRSGDLDSCNGATTITIAPSIGQRDTPRTIIHTVLGDATRVCVGHVNERRFARLPFSGASRCSARACAGDS
mmetsp:Transcript_60581/g.139785  ORF Transcript_60581/g.139785 Transcript_60581/m.139785 type:complete len:447 (-) Transcript_60581:1563-2903(-)